jgi:hypothetical protein
MADNCEQIKPKLEGSDSEGNQIKNNVPYKEPSDGSTFYGTESHFSEEVVFYQNVRIYGDLKTNFASLKDASVVVKELNVLNNSIFDGYSYFSNYVYVDKGINVGIATVRKKLDVGCGGTTLTADASTGNVGIGSTVPQQRLDVAGSVKIDENIYDSVNVPGKNGYQLVRDDGGIRWIPLIAEPIPGVPGIATDGIFILDEGVPLYQP